MTISTTIKEDLEIARAVIDAVEANLLTPDGKGFKTQPDLSDDANVAQAVEQALAKNGVVISAKVQRIISAVVTALELVQ